MFNPGTAEGWKSDIAMAARQAGVIPTEPWDCAIGRYLRFMMPRPKAHYRSNGELKPRAPKYFRSKPDADNFAKAVMDAMTVLGFWKDDKDVCDLHPLKYYCNPGQSAGCWITVCELAE